MESNKIFEEDIYSKTTTGLLITPTLVILFLLSYQILIEPIGSHLVPNWFLLLLFLFFLGCTVNFVRLTIRITTKDIKIRYGVFRRTILWNDIDNCYFDETSIISYGGWGIRIGKVDGKWRLVYNIIGVPRVVLSLKKGKFREFVFSTKNPDEVIEAIKQRINREEGAEGTEVR